MAINDAKMMFRLLTEGFPGSEAVLTNLTCKCVAINPASHEKHYRIAKIIVGIFCLSSLEILLTDINFFCQSYFKFMFHFFSNCEHY